MAHPASKQYPYFGQLGLFVGLTGAGLIAGAVVSVIPLLSSINLSEIVGGSKDIMTKLLVPENAGILRWMQFLTTLFLFFFPPYFYSLICHKKPLTHLGFKNTVSVEQFVTVVLIMLAALPIVSALAELTETLPLGKSIMAYAQHLEDEYNKQVAIIGRMDNMLDFFVSLLMLAILPALFEETFFRGGIQNLFTRWFKMPVLAIIITSFIFSFVHFSIFGFLSRFFLGYLLGWMYYRTGNLWLNIIAHATNNTVGITVMYIMKSDTPDANPQDTNFPYWVSIIAVIVLIGLIKLFERVSKYQEDQPGVETEIILQSSHDKWMNNS